MIVATRALRAPVAALAILLVSLPLQAFAEEAPPLPQEPTENPDPERFAPARSGEEPAPRSFESYATQQGDGGTAEGSRAAAWRPLDASDLLSPSASFPHIEWHGYFRFRTQSSYNLSLSTEGTSPVLPPLQRAFAPREDNDGGTIERMPSETGGDSTARYHDDGSTRLTGADIRLRLRPIVHVTESARIHVELQLLDNLVLGSTPQRWTGNPAGVDSQSSASSFEAADSVRVTQAYGEVQTVLGTLQAGRQASHWGLGILDHGGGDWRALREPRIDTRNVAMAGHSCLDCDYGTYVDRLQFETRLFDTYIALSWDYNDAGLLDTERLDAPGRSRGLGRFDNVTSYTLRLFQRPQSPSEIAARNRLLKELRQPAFDWGLYVVHRRMNTTLQEGGAADRWAPVGARLWMPDLWMRIQSEPSFRQRLRFEVEAVAVLGSIDNVAIAEFDAESGLEERSVRQFGAAAEFEYVNYGFSTGLNGGFATGRSPEAVGSRYFGFHDGPVNPIGEERLSAFYFHPNYSVDRILFREVIGTVTNATYFNPYIGYDFFSRQDDSLGLRLDLLTAFAANADATPSGEAFYGVETDLTLYYQEPRYGADLSFGLFVPGNAFNARAGRARIDSVADALGLPSVFESNQSARPAANLQARFFWAF